MSERNWSEFATNACSACIEKNGNETKAVYGKAVAGNRRIL